MKTQLTEHDYLWLLQYAMMNYNVCATEREALEEAWERAARHEEVNED